MSASVGPMGLAIGAMTALVVGGFAGFEAKRLPASGRVSLALSAFTFACAVGVLAMPSGSLLRSALGVCVLGLAPFAIGYAAHVNAQEPDQWPGRAAYVLSLMAAVPMIYALWGYYSPGITLP